MGELRNCVITMTHFKRPDYTRQSLEALSKCEGINHCLLLPHVEPDCQEVIDLLRAVDFCDCQVTVNPKRLHADPNTIRAFEEAFVLSDFLIHVEDDICLVPDALDYFWWARSRYNDDPQVLSIAGYNRSNAPHPVDYHSVGRRGWFHPWGVGIWRSRWTRWRDEVFAITGTDPGTLSFHPGHKGYKGWDGAFGVVQQRENLVEVHPVLSRVQNIGVKSSIHDPKWFTPEWHRINQHSAHWAGDGRYIGASAWHEKEPGKADMWKEDVLDTAK